MSLGNPMEAWMQMADAKNRNRQEMNQNIAGIGQGVGEGFNSIGQAMQEQKKKQLLAQIVAAMRQQGAPQQGPQMPTGPAIQGPAGYMPPNQGPNSTAIPAGQYPMPQNPTSGMGAPAQDNSKIIQSLMMQYDPQAAIRNIPTPLQQSEIAKNNAMAQRYQNGQLSKTVGTIYRNSSTGEMTDDPAQAQGPEWKKYSTTQGDVLNKLSGQTSAKERNKAVASRAEAMQRGIDVRQIDRLAQTVGVTQGQRNLLQQNNMRANRAIELASRPMTWQEFGAVTTDAAAIMQGGAPQVQQLHDMSYPSWKQELARAQTYITSTPTANVPDEFKNRIIDMIRGVQKVDNRYLTKNAEFMQKMMAPTIRGGIGQFKKPIQDMTDTITDSGGTPGNNDPLGLR